MDRPSVTEGDPKSLPFPMLRDSKSEANGCPVYLRNDSHAILRLTTDDLTPVCGREIFV